MYYDEKFDRDGWLWARSTPDGEWRKATAKRTVTRLWELLDEARLNAKPEKDYSIDDARRWVQQNPL